MDFLKKLQNLPESTRKIILWSLVIIIGLGLAAGYIKNFQQKLKNLKIENFKEEFKLPSLEEEVEGLPKIEMPKIYESE